MRYNVGLQDRLIRIAVGLCLIVATLLDVIGVWGWIGLVPLITGIFRVCPAYLLFDVNTCEARNQ